MRNCNYCIVVLLFVAFCSGLVAQNNTGILVRADTVAMRAVVPDASIGEAIRMTVLNPLTDWAWDGTKWVLMGSFDAVLTDDQDASEVPFDDTGFQSGIKDANLTTSQELFSWLDNYIFNLVTGTDLWTDDGDGSYSIDGRIDVGVDSDNIGMGVLHGYYLSRGTTTGFISQSSSASANTAAYFYAGNDGVSTNAELRLNHRFGYDNRRFVIDYNNVGGMLETDYVRLFELSSAGSLNLPSYGLGVANFDANGNLLSGTIPSTLVTGLEQYENYWTKLTNNNLRYDNRIGINTDPLYDIHIKGQGSNSSIMLEGGTSTGYAWNVVRNDATQSLTSISRGSAATGSLFGLDNANNQFIYSSQSLGVGTFIARDFYLGTNKTARQIIRSGGNVEFVGRGPGYATFTNDVLGSTSTIPSDDISLNATNFDEIGTTYDDVQSAIQRINDLLGSTEIPNNEIVYGASNVAYASSPDFKYSEVTSSLIMQNPDGASSSIILNNNELANTVELRMTTSDNFGARIEGFYNHDVAIHRSGGSDGTIKLEDQKISFSRLSNPLMEVNHDGTISLKFYTTPGYITNDSSGDLISIEKIPGHDVDDALWFDFGVVSAAQVSLGTAADYDDKTGVKCDCSDIGDTLLTLPDLEDGRVLTIHNEGSETCLIAGGYTTNAPNREFGGANSEIRSKRSMRVQKHGIGTGSYWSLFDN